MTCIQCGREINEDNRHWASIDKKKYTGKIQGAIKDKAYICTRCWDSRMVSACFGGSKGW